MPPYQQTYEETFEIEKEKYECRCKYTCGGEHQSVGDEMCHGFSDCVLFCVFDFIFSNFCICL